MSTESNKACEQTTLTDGNITAPVALPHNRNDDLIKPDNAISSRAAGKDLDITQVDRSSTITTPTTTHSSVIGRPAPTSDSAICERTIGSGSNSTLETINSTDSLQGSMSETTDKIVKARQVNALVERFLHELTGLVVIRSSIAGLEYGSVKAILRKDLSSLHSDHWYRHIKEKFQVCGLQLPSAMTEITEYGKLIVRNQPNSHLLANNENTSISKPQMTQARVATQDAPLPLPPCGSLRNTQRNSVIRPIASKSHHAIQPSRPPGNVGQGSLVSPLAKPSAGYRPIGANTLPSVVQMPPTHLGSGFTHAQMVNARPVFPQTHQPGARPIQTQYYRPLPPVPTQTAQNRALASHSANNNFHSGRGLSFPQSTNPGVVHATSYTGHGSVQASFRPNGFQGFGNPHSWHPPDLPLSVDWNSNVVSKQQNNPHLLPERPQDQRLCNAFSAINQTHHVRSLGCNPCKMNNSRPSCQPTITPNLLNFPKVPNFPRTIPLAQLPPEFTFIKTTFRSKTKPSVIAQAILLAAGKAGSNRLNSELEWYMSKLAFPPLFADLQALDYDAIDPPTIGSRALQPSRQLTLHPCIQTAVEKIHARPVVPQHPSHLLSGPRLQRRKKAKKLTRPDRLTTGATEIISSPNHVNDVHKAVSSASQASIDNLPSLRVASAGGRMVEKARLKAPGLKTNTKTTTSQTQPSNSVFMHTTEDPIAPSASPAHSTISLPASAAPRTVVVERESPGTNNTQSPNLESSVATQDATVQLKLPDDNAESRSTHTVSVGVMKEKEHEQSVQSDNDELGMLPVQAQDKSNSGSKNIFKVLVPRRSIDLTKYYFDPLEVKSLEDFEHQRDSELWKLAEKAARDNYGAHDHDMAADQIESTDVESDNPDTLGFPEYHCSWNNCRACLHDYNLLLLHIEKKHGRECDPHGWRCHWDSCHANPPLFPTKRRWFEHVEVEHCETVRYQCLRKGCKRCFGRPEDLLIHQEKQHAGNNGKRRRNKRKRSQAAASQSHRKRKRKSSQTVPIMAALPMSPSASTYSMTNSTEHDTLNTSAQAGQAQTYIVISDDERTPLSAKRIRRQANTNKRQGDLEVDTNSNSRAKEPWAEESTKQAFAQQDIDEAKFDLIPGFKDCFDYLEDTVLGSRCKHRILVEIG